MFAMIFSAAAALATLDKPSPDTRPAPPTARSFAIVDRETGRIVGTLVAVDDTARVFRLIGDVPRMPCPETAAVASPATWLTPEQLQASLRADERARFYRPPDAG